MENFESMDWESLPPMQAPQLEMKKIRSSLRKRNFLIISTCLILVAVLLFCTVQYGIPALEKQYWDPNTCTHADDTSDLALSMMTYTELFCPGRRAIIVDSVKTGFATHTITATFSDRTDPYSISQKNAVLSKDKLTFSAGFWENYHTNAFNLTAEKILKKVDRDTMSSLKEYPDYVQLLAAVHFPEDLDMNEVYQFRFDVEANTQNPRISGSLIWVNIRNRTTEDPWRPACGLEPFRVDSFIEWKDDSEYALLDHSDSARTIESRFLAMLRFLQEQTEQGKGFQPPDCADDNYYTEVLEYVEENGVMANGAYIIASSDLLLELYETGQIDGITLCDAWIDY